MNTLTSHGSWRIVDDESGDTVQVVHGERVEAERVLTAVLHKTRVPHHLVLDVTG